MAKFCQRPKGIGVGNKKITLENRRKKLQNTDGVPNVRKGLIKISTVFAKVYKWVRFDIVLICD